MIVNYLLWIFAGYLIMPETAPTGQRILAGFLGSCTTCPPAFIMAITAFIAINMEARFKILNRLLDESVSRYILPKFNTVNLGQDSVSFTEKKGLIRQLHITKISHWQLYEVVNSFNAVFGLSICAVFFMLIAVFICVVYLILHGQPNSADITRVCINVVISVSVIIFAHIAFSVVVFATRLENTVRKGKKHNYVPVLQIPRHIQ